MSKRKATALSEATTEPTNQSTNQSANQHVETPVNKPAPMPQRTIVFPGDPLSFQGSLVRLGNGLIQAGPNIIATKAGTINQSANSSKLSISNTQKRYIPCVDDCVIGQVIEKQGEAYRIDIGGPELSSLNELGFDGASKRNKPNILNGALVYARVLSIDRDMEPELTCVAVHSKKDWVTGASFFGELTGGMSIQVSIAFAAMLLDPATADTNVLALCGAHVPYEVAIGQNGRIWINAEHRVAAILVANAVVNAQFLDHKQTQGMVDALMKTIQS